MNPAEWLARTALRSPEAPALLTGDYLDASYRDFADRAAAIGGLICDEFGIGPGDRVALFAKNSTRYIEAMYGGWFAGAALVPINAKLHPREAAWIIADSGAKLVFADGEASEELSAVLTGNGVPVVELQSDRMAQMRRGSGLPEPVPLQPDDMIWLFYTSGTTGKPKGVMLTSANIQAMALSYLLDVDSVEAADAALYAAPLSHGAGIYNFMHVMTGARHVVPQSGGFDPAEILALAPRIDRVSMFAAPTMIRRLVDEAKRKGSNGEGIKTIVYGGGPMYLADIVDAVEVMGPRFVQIYGQGECPMAITALRRELVCDRDHRRWRERLASVGLAQSSVRVRIADEAGSELPRGEIGEILVQGLPVMAGYWNNEKATAKTIRDGWLWTGDMGAMDDEGFVTLHDRSKDLIISGGTNIYPREVEEVLLTHPAVSEAAVVGRKDPEWGEDVVAFVVAAEDVEISKADIDRHCLDNMARFKRPKAYFFVEELPKNNYGKVLKTELRERLDAQAGQKS